MRPALLALALLLAAPAVAQDWGHYENARFGYAIDVPPGFNWGRESDNGDGRLFRDGTRRLTVWGGRLEAGFDLAAAAAVDAGRDDGWTITYEAAAPGWMSYSGTQGQRVRYERWIALCGDAYAAFRLEHAPADIGVMGPVVEQLVGSFEGTC